MSDVKENKSMFYSTFSNEIKSMLQEGSRVFTFIEINKKQLPEGLVQKSSGTPNCKVIFKEDSIDIFKLGDNIGLIMKKKKKVCFIFQSLKLNILN